MDFEAGTILFRRPKGGKRKRVRDVVATMTPRVLAALQARYAAPRSAIYVFPGSSPHRPLVNHLKRFQAALIRAGLPREIVPYSARHTALTNLANAGLPTKDIRDAAGHSRITTTERYLHAGRGVGEKVAAILGAVGETSQAKAERTAR